MEADERHMNGEQADRLARVYSREWMDGWLAFFGLKEFVRFLSARE